MDRVAAFLGVLGLAAAVGALAVGDLALLPALTGEHPLLDANQAVSIRGPIHLRCAEVALVGTIVAALAVPRWLGSRLATTVSLLAIACAGVSRLALLPRVYDAFSKVDLVAGRPAQRFVEAQELASQTLWIDGSLAALLLLLVGIAASRNGRADATPAPAPQATAEGTPAAA